MTQVSEIEQELDAFCNKLAEGWRIAFRFSGSLDGWSIVLTHGAADSIMWESDPHDSLTDALTQATSERDSILLELEG